MKLFLSTISALMTLTVAQPGGGGRGPGGGGGPGGTTCSNTVPTFLSPSASANCESWHANETYSYPSEFTYTNQFAEYTCPTSGVRIFVSNGIPDHQVTVNNPNSPCEIPWQVVLPLNPEKASELTEPQALGIVAIATNGVPVYGAQEGGGSNAVAPTASSQVQDAQYWWGHAAPSHDWHYHHPALGHSGNWGEDVLLGYALDGYPIYGAKNSTDSLDSCNFDEKTQRYHVRTREQVDGDSDYCNGDSAAIQWNYTIGCYVGSLSKTKVENSSTASIPTDCVLVNGKKFQSSTSSSNSSDGGENVPPGNNNSNGGDGNNSAPPGNDNNGGDGNNSGPPGNDNNGGDGNHNGPPGNDNNGSDGNHNGPPGNDNNGGDGNHNGPPGDDDGGENGGRGHHRGSGGNTGDKIEKKIEQEVHGKYGFAFLLTGGALIGLCVAAIARKFCNCCTSRYPKAQQISSSPLRSASYYLAPKDLEGAETRIPVVPVAVNTRITT